MKYWRNVEKQSQQTERLTASESSKELLILHRAFSLYAEGFVLAPRESDDPANIARYGLLSQNLNWIKSAIDLATRGLYLQSISTLRAVYENWLAFWYLVKFPEHADRWLALQTDQPRPNIETMRNKIDYRLSEQKTKLHDLYKMLNRYVHTDSIAVLSQIKKPEDQIVLYSGIEYERDRFLLCAYYISLSLEMVLDAVGMLVPEGDEWHERPKKIKDEMLVFIERMNRTHLSLTRRHLKNIF